MVLLYILIYFDDDNYENLQKRLKDGEDTAPFIGRGIQEIIGKEFQQDRRCRSWGVGRWLCLSEECLNPWVGFGKA